MSPEERAQAKADKAQAAAEKKEAAEQRPLSIAESYVKHAEGVQMYADQQDRADRTLSRLPAHMPMQVADGKIHKYVFDSTHIDGASKAKGFEALGHPIRPGGTECPLSQKMYEHGEALKRNIIAGTEGRTAEMTLQEPEKLAEGGVKFKVTAPLTGVGAKADKQTGLDTIWIDKRVGEESSRGVLELATLIPQGKKK